MILGARRRDSSPQATSQPATVKITERCERPHDHPAHEPYVRPGSNADYSCPGGPLDPTLFHTDEPVVAS